MGSLFYKRTHEKKGLCRDCSRPAYPLRYCLKHRSKRRLDNRKNNKKFYKMYANNGCCVRCSVKKHPDMDRGFKLCLNCRERI